MTRKRGLEDKAKVLFKGIVFDFNGVLCWDGHYQIEAWQQSARILRGSEFTDHELETHMHGRTNQHVFSYLMNRPVQGEELLKLVDQKESAYRRLCLAQGERFTLSPGAEDLLDFLALHNVPRTIATASGFTNLDFFTVRLRLARWFRLPDIVYDDGTLPGKPAPDVFLMAARNLGVEPRNCVVVEDSLSGIQAAHNAGIGHVVALGPREVHDRLLGIEAVDSVVENLGQLKKEELFTGQEL
ncbi:MAG TPA: HAD family phosphatase [bacterium]